MPQVSHTLQARHHNVFHPRHKLTVTRHKSPAAAPCAIKGLDAKISWMMKFDALASLLPLPLPLLPLPTLLLLLLDPRIPKRGNSLQRDEYDGANDDGYDEMMITTRLFKVTLQV